MNFGQMQTALQRYGFDTTDPLAIWLNAAKNEMASAQDWPWLEEGPTVVVQAAGSNTVALPADFGKMITIRDKDHLLKLKYWSRRKFTRLIQDQTDQGWPEVYTLIGQGSIQIWRVPVVPVNIEVVYQANCPDMVNAGDVPQTVGGNLWPTYAHYPIVMRAASLALQAENEEDRARVAQSEYEKGLMLCAAQIGERELDEPETVEDAQGYGGSSDIRGLASGGY